MVLSYTLIGTMVAPEVHWDRVVAILIGYFFALGIAAHALDALGSKRIKPWGAVFSSRELLLLAIISLIIAYSIGIYFIIFYAPFLWVIAILEGFFVVAYNLEWFQGRFHTDHWFVFSWGFLPVLAGYVLQTNRLSISAIVLASSAALLSYVEITASRPYKETKRNFSILSLEDIARVIRYERILKSISFGTILLGLAMALWRWNSS